MLEDRIQWMAQCKCWGYQHQCGNVLLNGWQRCKPSCQYPACGHPQKNDLVTNGQTDPQGLYGRLHQGTWMGLIDQGVTIWATTAQPPTLVTSPMSRQTIAVQVGTDGLCKSFGHRPALLTTGTPPMEKHDGILGLLMPGILGPVNLSFGTCHHRAFARLLNVFFHLRWQKRRCLMLMAGNLFLCGLDAIDFVDDASKCSAEPGLEQDDSRCRSQCRQGENEPVGC